MRFGAFGLLLPLVLVATAAHADDKTACADAALKGQSLLAEHKLLEAREELRACVQPRCPTIVQNDCSGWLADVEKALPTVVITAKDTAGRDIVDVDIWVDGKPLKLQGASLPMDPGVHTIHFESDSAATLDRRVVVKEGIKNQDISIVLPPKTAPSDKKVAQTAPEQTEAWRTTGWVLGAMGVVGLGIGVGFGVKAISDKSIGQGDAGQQLYLQKIVFTPSP